MKLTNATEKACAVVAMLATQHENEPIPSSLIVKRLHISESYTKKLLRKLVVGNVISSVTGTKGGFKLVKNLNEISLLDIVEAIEGEISTYPDHGTLIYAFTEFHPMTVDGEKAVKEAFKQADDVWRETLRKQTIDKLFNKALGYEKPEIDWLDL